MVLTKVNDLADAIARELEEYNQEVTESLKEEIKQVAKEVASEIKQKSPENSGEYKKGWKVRVEYEDPDDIRIRIYNSKKPQLTHLLEHGHANQNGGRMEGNPHIGPAEQNAEKKLSQKVKVVVKG